MVRRDAWGKELYRLGNLASSNYLFTGQRWDKLLGLYDYNARYYDAELGRFLSADTVTPDDTNPQAYNRFTYVFNNAINKTDPTGHRPDEGDGDGDDKYSEFEKYGFANPEAIDFLLGDFCPKLQKGLNQAWAFFTRMPNLPLPQQGLPAD